MNMDIDKDFSDFGDTSMDIDKENSFFGDDSSEKMTLQPRTSSRNAAAIPVVPDNRNFRESNRSLVQNFERDMKERQREIEDDMRTIERSFLDLRPVDEPRSGGGIIRRLSRRGRDDVEVQDDEELAQPIIIRDPESGNHVCRVTFDVRNFRPDDVRVSVEGKNLVVRGVQKKSRYTPDTSTLVKQNFVRSVTLPPEVNRSQLQAKMSADGILSLQAPLLIQPSPSYTNSTRSLRRSKSMNDQQRSLETYGTMPRKRGTENVAGGYALTVPARTRRKLKLAVEIGKGFTPKDIVVKNVLTENKFMVEATNDNRKKFAKTFRWPVAVDSESISAILKNDGRLIITAYPTEESNNVNQSLNSSWR